MFPTRRFSWVLLLALAAVAPTAAQELDRVADELRIKLAIDADNNTRGTLGIEFGPHRLIAPLKMRFAVE